MADGVVFSEQAFRQLKRELAELRLRYRNLDRQVTAQRAGQQGSTGYTDRPPVMVRNQSGGTLDRGSVVEFIDEHVRAVPRAGKLWFDGDTPDLTNPGWGILDRKIPDGRSCKCYVTGPCVALVNVTSTSHTHADLANGNAVLQSGTSGPFIILHHSGSTGEQLCPGIIDRGGNKHWLLKADAQVNAGASGTFSIWTGTAGSESDTGTNDTFFNRTDATISSGAFCEGVEIGGQKYAVPWTCP